MLAKKEVFGIPVMGYLFEKWGAIPVDRENPGHSSISTVVEKLNQDRIVTILPEGHRYQLDELGEFQRGAAMIARLGQAPTIPAAIRGVDSFGSSMMHRSAEVCFGAPIDYPESKKDEQEYLLTLRESIQNLMDS